MKRGKHLREGARHTGHSLDFNAGLNFPSGLVQSQGLLNATSNKKIGNSLGNPRSSAELPRMGGTLQDDHLFLKENRNLNASLRLVTTVPELAILSELGTCLRGMLADRVNEALLLSEIYRRTLKSVLFQFLTLKNSQGVAFRENKRLAQAEACAKRTKSEVTKAYGKLVAKDSRITEYYKDREKACITLENSNLTLRERVEFLESLISEISREFDIGDLCNNVKKYKDQHEQAVRELNSLKYRKDIEISQIETKIGDLKQEIKKELTTMNDIRLERKELISILNDLEDKLTVSEKQNQQLREINQMQREDLRITINHLENTAAKYKSDLKPSKKVHSRKDIVVNIEETDENAMSKINNEILALNIVPIKHLHETNFYRDLDKEIATEARTNSSRNNINVDPDQIDLSEFKLHRPSLYSLFKLTSKRAVYEPPFHFWVEITIRALFDSKYNEHTSCRLNSNKTPSNFPVFVYT